MLITQSLIAAAGLAFSALASSCDASFQVTPVSAEGTFHLRTGEALSYPTPLPFPCPHQIVGSIQLESGTMVFLIDIDCDGFPDIARMKNRQWEIRQSPGELAPDWFTSPGQSLPGIDPGFGNRSAEEWISAMGLDDLRQATHVHAIWVNGISTSEWTLDVSIPSSSACRRPAFGDFDLGYQWSVLPGRKGPDFEVWRVAGDLTEVLRFLVACGTVACSVETPAGPLEFRVAEDASSVAVTLDGVPQDSVPLD